MAAINQDYSAQHFDTGHEVDLLADNNHDGNEEQEGQHTSTEDTAVWCEKCGIHNIGDCFIHGGKMTVTPDNAMPTRACLSLPKILTLKRVRDSDPCSLEAKRGVFSKKFIKLRTLFGPMEAKRLNTKPKLQTGMMEYQLQTSDQAHEYLDTSDENSSNWMMFVRPANVFAQQNMAAFQDKGNIYFVTCKNVQKGTELRVWYTAAYAKSIGKRILIPEPTDRKQPFATIKKEKKSVQSLQEKQHNSVPTSVVNFIESVQDMSERNHVKNSSMNNKMTAISPNEKYLTTSPLLPGKGTRSARATKDNLVVFACNTCNTTFAKLGHLDQHICKELGEGEEDNSGYGTRRRKGKPRKLLDNEDGSSAGKIAKVDTHRPEMCIELSSANIPHEDIISHLNGDDVSTGECARLFGDTDAGMTLLPSTALIPTTAEFCGDDGENQPTSKNKRGPGRPKGSKNKQETVVKTKSQIKDDATSGKRQVYTCKYCEKTFTSKEQHVVHEASHTNTLPYTCNHPGCGKSFNSKFKHQRHLAVHDQPNNFPCKFCASTFNRVDHLKNHLLVHDSNRDIFTCTICGKSYLYKANLTFHMAKHEAEKGDSLRCLVCCAKFESNEQLKVHIGTHNRYKKELERQRKYSCSQCHKLFATAKDIKRHMLTHSKERHFLCEHCPQTFVRKDHLRRHYTSNHKQEFYHTQLKDSPFGCNTCLLVFKKKDFLDYHMKTIHPEGVKTPEIRSRREKIGRYTAKLASVCDSVDENPQQSVVKINKDSQNQLAKLSQKQPVQRPDTPTQQLIQFTSKVQQSMSTSQQQLDALPLNVVKIQQMNNQNNSPRPYAIVYPASIQASASLTPIGYDSEDISETLTAKTVPFRFQNQLASQQQLQGQSTSQLHKLQPHSQQATDQHQQIQQGQQSLLSQIQLQQQQQAQVHQQQQYQQLQHQQVQPQPVTSMVQGMHVDILNSLAGLTQAQDIPENSNTNLFNIITVGGQNFIVRPAQVLNLNKPVQLTVIKDSQMESKQSPQQQPQSHTQHLGVKSEGGSLVYSRGQVLRGNVSKPDHCYASATMTNPTLSHILSNQNKTQMSGLDKTNVLQGPSITDEEATRIMAQLKNATGGSNIGIGSNLSETTQSQNELLMNQQLRQLQQMHQDSFQQQDNQQQQDQQPLQNLPSFTLAWSDNLSDYTSITELPVSGDMTSINQNDGFSTIIPGSTPSSWILQLPATMLDQPQIQNLQDQLLPNSHIMNVTTPGPVSHN